VEKDEDSPTKRLYIMHIQARHAGTYTCTGVIGGNEQQKSVSLLLFSKLTLLTSYAIGYVFEPSSVLLAYDEP